MYLRFRSRDVRFLLPATSRGAQRNSGTTVRSSGAGGGGQGDPPHLRTHTESAEGPRISADTTHCATTPIGAVLPLDALWRHLAWGGAWFQGGNVTGAGTQLPPNTVCTM